MAYRSYRQTLFNIALVTLDEYGKKLVHFGRFVLLCFLFFLALSLVLGSFGLNAVDAENRSVVNRIAYGSWMLLDVLPPVDGVGESNEMVWPVRMFGFVLSALFAGVSVAILLNPVNTIKFSRYAVLDLDKERVRFRYWVRKPENQFLYDAQMELIIMTESDVQNGDSDVRYLFRYREPENMDSVPVERYMAIRGVRYCSIPLDQKSSTEEEATLQDALAEAFKGKGFRARFRVSGTDDGGRVAYRDRTYRLGDFLIGYNFLSIRADEIKRKAVKFAEKDGQQLTEEEKAKLCPNMEKRKKRLYHEHFDVVYEQSEADESKKARFPEIRRNRPMPIYLTKSLDCVPDGFRAREFAYIVREWLNRKLLNRFKKVSKRG